MYHIFQPILSSVAIYIDNILLYSLDEQSHCQLVEQFTEIVKKHGIMLSQRKMNIAQIEIEFFGMHLNKGTYYPGPHIAQELLNFPQENFTTKQVQQFLWIINYLRILFQTLQSC